MTSSQHGSYTQGYTHPTMAKTMSSKPVTASKSLKISLSSDWGLQPDPMKPELLVIANQQVAVNTFSPLVQNKCAWQFRKLNGVNPLFAQAI